MFNASAFKQQFPIFSHPENEGLVYLDNAATTQRPQCVIDAITDFYSRYNANTHRSSHRLSRQATVMVEQARSAAMAFLSAARPEEVIFTSGATDALNLLAGSLTQRLSPGDEIVLSPVEHHANLVPWQMAAQRHGLVLKFLPTLDDSESWREVVTDRTSIVSMTAASNATGQRLPMASLKAMLPERALLLVDASQILAHESVDVVAMGCDFLVGSAHKFYGPTGVGLLYGRYEQLQNMPPWKGGGEMIERVDWLSSEYTLPPHRFEAGTSPLAAISGLNACLSWLQAQDRGEMARYESLLNRYLHTELAALERDLPIRLLTDFNHNVGIAAIAPTPAAGVAAADIGDWLDEQDIAVRVGHHCAQPYIDSLGTGSTLRVSLAAYNNRSDVDRLVQALKTMPYEKTGRVASPMVVGDQVFADDLSSADVAQLRQQASWQKRYRQLTRWSTLMSRKPSIRTDENRVSGCETDVWLVHRQLGDRHEFAIDTDSRVIQGLGVLLLLCINGCRRAELLALDMEQLFADLGLSKYLSPSRSNGFRALLDAAIEKSDQR